MSKTLLILFLFTSLFCPEIIAKELPINGWRFNNGPEYPGATGSLKDNRGELTLRSDFRKGGAYVAAYQILEIPLVSETFQFQVKSSAVGMAVRFDDEDGQTHQHFFPLSGDSSVWQSIDVPVTGSAEHHWGGKNDGVLRGAVKRVDLVVHTTSFPSKHGSLIFSGLRIQDKFAANTAPIPLASTAWSLNRGTEFPPGADASVETRGNKLFLKVNCSKGGNYGALTQVFASPLNAERIHFKMRGTNRQVAVRLVDSEGQCHNHLLNASGNPEEEQSFSLDITGSSVHWGGREDGVFHGGLGKIELVVCGEFYGESKKGETEFYGIALESNDLNANIAAWSIPDPLRLFRRIGDTSPVEIQVMSHQARSDALSYSYRDYSNSKVAAGEAKYDAKTGMLLSPPPPGRGFFELVYPGLGVRVGIMVDDPAPETPDEFFAVDGSFSWGGPPDSEKDIRSYLRILHQNGIIWNRDRLAWPLIEPRQNQFNFGERYGLYRKIAVEEGIKTLDTFHESPAWTGAGPNFQPYGSKINPYPEQLFAAGKSFAAIVSHWEDTVKALEVWNEPDYGFGNFFPPEYVTAFTKAVSRTFADAGMKQRVIGGVISVTRPGTGYYDAFVRNGLLADSDTISYHTYADTVNLEQELGALRKVEQELAPEYAGIPLWLTECGKAWPRGSYRATQPDDMYSAVEIAAKAMETRALGLERYFAFEYKYYDEFHVNFGMMDSKHTPMRSMGAYVHLVRVLSHREYVGDLRGTNALRARVFANNENLVAVLYSGVKEARQQYFQLPGGLEFLRATDIDGRLLEVKSGCVSAGNGLVYLYLPLKAERFINSDTTAMRLYRMAKDYKPHSRAARPLVLQPATNLNQFEVDRYGFMTREFKPLEFSAKINNFGDQPLEFDPEVKTDNGIRILQMPLKTTIPPHETMQVALIVDFDPAIHPDRFRSIYLGDRNGNATDICFSVWNLSRTPVYPVTEMEQTVQIADLQKGKNWKDISKISCWIPCTGFIMEPNIGAEFRIFHSTGELIYQVLVKDPAHCNNFTPDQAWRGDSVQLTVQMRPENGKETGNWTELTASHGPQGNILWRNGEKQSGPLEKSKLKFIRFPDGYSFYEIRLDADELGLQLAPGRLLGSTILVNSNSGNGRDGYLSWGSGIATEKDDRLFQLFELK